MNTLLYITEKISIEKHVMHSISVLRSTSNLLHTNLTTVTHDSLTQTSKLLDCSLSLTIQISLILCTNNQQHNLLVVKMKQNMVLFVEPNSLFGPFLA